MNKKKLRKLKKKIKKYEDKEKKKPKLDIHPETKRGVAAVILFTLAVIFVLSFQGVGGFLGEYLLKGSKFVFGSCLWLVPLAFIAAGIAILKEIHRNVFLST